ncbi:MAG: hypothetical protein AAF602_29530, partial [Myxococcota bacterium]
EILGGDVLPPPFPTLRRLALQYLSTGRHYVAETVHGCLALEELTVIGTPDHPPFLDVTMLGSGHLAQTLRVLRLVTHRLPTNGEPQWSSFQRLEQLSLLRVRAMSLTYLRRTLDDLSHLPALRGLDLRWTETLIGAVKLPGWARIERLERLGTSIGPFLSSLSESSVPLPALRHLSLAGVATPGQHRALVDSHGSRAPSLERLDLHVDSSPTITGLWADALDDWPRLHTLTLPANMLRRPEAVARWVRSPVFRGLKTLVLHGGSPGLRPLAEGMAEAGMSPRIVCDLGMRSGAVDLLRRAGFCVDRVDDLGAAVDDRDWSAPDLR